MGPIKYYLFVKCLINVDSDPKFTTLLLHFSLITPHLGVLQPELLQRAGQRQPLPVSGVARVASETFVKTAPEVEVVTAEIFSFVLNTLLNT